MLVQGILAQKEFSAGGIKPKTNKSPHEGRAILTRIENLYDTTVIVKVINEYDNAKEKEIVLKKDEFKNLDFTFNVVKARPVTNKNFIEIRRISTYKPKDKAESLKAPDNLQLKVAPPVKDEKEKEQEPSKPQPVPPAVPKAVMSAAIAAFEASLDTMPFLSSANRASDSAIVVRHLDNLRLASIDKVAYISDQRLNDYVAAISDSISFYNIDSLVTVFLRSYKGGSLSANDSCKNKLSAIVTKRIAAREQLIAPLKDEIVSVAGTNQVIGWKKPVAVGGAVLLLCIILGIWYYRANKKHPVRPQKRKVSSTTGSDPNNRSLIVVNRQTTHMLRKQSLDDVYDNAAYLRIDAKDFSADSAVRTMYIKNSCIKEIYNMYAEDLRNPNNPKEDGCMVLGRWVYDTESGLYDVSLEYVVFPGDDAIFSEYELNFGGKIKLRVSERLRALRRETGLQYDLTCWIHSHPNLGVFFSNSDNNVHMLLKHPTHPKFLTALVIDILTDTMVTGIFTFKQDETLNSKNDLTKLYSLDEMYKWSLASERKSFDAANYFDALAQTKFHLDSCDSIQLSNGAIIDMTFLAVKPTGFVGFVHGYTLERGNRTQCVTSSVSKSNVAADNNIIGCFVVASHCSIPSIRKAVASYLHIINFVLVYTATDGLLTAIPVERQDLCDNNAYYTEHKLEDLKIWTRRKR